MNNRPGNSDHATATLEAPAPSKPAARYAAGQLGGLRRFAVAITVFNVLGHAWFGFEQSYAQPLASLATAYVTQLLLEALDAWAQGRRPGFTRSGGALVVSLLSAHISGLACSMLLYANDRIWVVCFASAAAIASKTLFRMPVGTAKGAWPLVLFQLTVFLLLLQTGEPTRDWIPVPFPVALGLCLGAVALVAVLPPGPKTRHYLNPSNFGIAVTLLLFPSVGVAAPYQFTENLRSSGDWVVPMVIVCTGSLLNTFFTRRMPLALAWVGTYALQAVVSSLILDYTTGHCPIAARLSGMTGVAFILFTFYMVTDPGTTPERFWSQIAFGASVALVYGVLLASHVVFGLFAALVIVCVARGLGMYLLTCLRKEDG